MSEPFTERSDVVDIGMAVLDLVNRLAAVERTVGSKHSVTMQWVYDSIADLRTRVAYLESPPRKTAPEPQECAELALEALKQVTGQERPSAIRRVEVYGDDNKLLGVIKVDAFGWRCFNDREDTLPPLGRAGEMDIVPTRFVFKEK